MLVQVFRNRTVMSGQVGTGLDSSRQFGYRSGRVRTCRNKLEQVVTCPSMSGHVMRDRFLWGHVGTGCSSRTVQVGTGLDRTGLFGTSRDWSDCVWTGRNRSVQVGICLYRSFGTGRIFRERSAQVWIRRDNSVTGRDVSGHVGTNRDNSGLFLTCRGRFVVSSCDKSGHVGGGRET
jgi:hypothetical protein